VTVMSSHAGDDAVGVTWLWHDVDDESCWRRCYRVMLAMALPGRLSRDVMLMSSHTGDSAAKSCWRWRYRGNLASMRC
jgi:hypothetical protein